MSCAIVQAAGMGKGSVLKMLEEGASVAMYHTAGKVHLSFSRISHPIAGGQWSNAFLCL